MIKDLQANTLNPVSGGLDNISCFVPVIVIGVVASWIVTTTLALMALLLFLKILMEMLPKRHISALTVMSVIPEYSTS